MKIKILETEFVEFMPTKINEGILYVSMQYSTAVHKCCCGCGNKVITPLSPTDWKLIYDGVSISLSPSIGNWNFECQSHYWIKSNKIEWSEKWSHMEIDRGRKIDKLKKREYFKEELNSKEIVTTESIEKPNIFSKFLNNLSKLFSS